MFILMLLAILLQFQPDNLPIVFYDDFMDVY
jgi:hypothetical protein